MFILVEDSILFKVDVFIFYSYSIEDFKWFSLLFLNMILYC